VKGGPETATRARTPRGYDQPPEFARPGGRVEAFWNVVIPLCLIVWRILWRALDWLAAAALIVGLGVLALVSLTSGELFTATGSLSMAVWCLFWLVYDIDRRGRL